jgi:protoheme IX farnesyltransferase
MSEPADRLAAGMPAPAEDAVTSGRPLRFVADLISLTKPRITGMVVATMLGGAWLAAHHGGSTGVGRLCLALAGTALVVAAANTLNMYLERESDRWMARTRNRPLPAGRMAAPVALAFGLALSAVSVPLLTFGVNAITGLLAAFALVSYVVLYTPLKRRTTLALLIGAVPGAIPPLLGWTTVAGRVEWPGVLLFGVLFLWQVPHFLAIATFRREDYRRAGLKILPVERGDRVTRIHIVGYLLALVAVTFALVPAGIGGPLYVGAALVLGAAFLAFGLWGLRPASGARWARGLFATSIVYLVLLLAALMVSPINRWGAPRHGDSAGNSPSASLEHA